MLSELNRRKNVDGNDLMKLSSQLQIFLLPAKLDKLLSHKHSLAAKYSLIMEATEASFNTLEPKTCVSGKTQYLLAIGRDKKVSFMDRPSPSKRKKATTILLQVHV